MNVEEPVTAEVVVWVPAGSHLVSIEPRSGIVSTRPARDGRIVVDYEGGIYRQSGMDVFANRVFHAWDRQVADYPTTARMCPPVDHLVRVGTFDTVDGVIVVEDHDALAAWLGGAAEDAGQLICTVGHRYAVRRQALDMFASGDPVKVAMARKFAATAGLVEL